MDTPSLSIIICTYNPRLPVLAKTLEHLGRQQAPPGETLELLIVDNASKPPLQREALPLDQFPYPARLLQEATPGLIHARLCGARHAAAPLLLFVDDDNYLEPDYAAEVIAFFREKPRAGAASGRVLAQAELEIPSWMTAKMVEHYAVRDLGEEQRLFRGLEAPYGAGMAVRKAPFLESAARPFVFSGRKGKNLSSGEDCEICFRMKYEGWELWYNGRLKLQHYLYQSRLTAEYYERFQYAFGFDKPVMEMFWAPGTPWRRLTYLKRCLQLSWTLFWERPESITTDVPGVLHRRFDRAWRLGMRDSLWRLAWGAPVWRQIQTLKPE